MRQLLYLGAMILLASCAHHKGGGCGGGDCGGHGAAAPEGAAGPAKAQVVPLAKNKVKGSVKFSTAGEDLNVSISLSGLKPSQKQGFHIHEFGDCTAVDGASAGGHWNPDNNPHGSMSDEKHHGGDLGNVTADAKGQVQTEILMLKTSVQQVLGRAVVVHAKEDDLKTQPAGAAGDRIACGVIGLTQ